MKIIKCMTEQIEEEIEDAKKYAEMALRYKEERPDIAFVYLKLSEDEMGHMTKIHDMVATLIADYRSKHGDPPVEMMAVYNYLHDRHIEKAAEVKSIQDMYRR